MADHGAENHGETKGTPVTDNHTTYQGFLAASKWGVITVAMALILMAIFLV